MVSELLLNDLLERFRPGSFNWTWPEEFIDIKEHSVYMFGTLLADITVNGIREPVLLGNDGRVWDGHKRITAAFTLGIPSIPIEYAEDLRDSS